MTRIGWIGLTVAGLAVTGCTSKSSTGAIKGRVVDAVGHPVAGTTLMLDHANGRKSLANSHGEFEIGGAGSGSHKVLALGGGHLAAAVSATVDANGVTDVGDVFLEDCSVIVANGGSTPQGGPDGTTTGSNGGTATPVATSPGGTDPSGNGGAPNPTSTDAPPTDPDGTIPCTMDPPPPPPEHLSFDTLNADYASGSIDPSGIYGWAWDSADAVGFDFYVAGDFTAGGSATVHVNGASADPTNGPAIAAGSMFLYTDSGYMYVLESGDLSVTVTPGANPDPSPMPTPVLAGSPGANGSDGSTGPTDPPTQDGGANFDFHGANLSFDYFSWDGTIDGTHTASANAATASGNAWVYIPPAPPTADITIANFVADWSEISLCPGCDGNGGDMLMVYAYDSVDQADMYFSMPVSSLSVPGSASITGSVDGSSQIYGGADVFGGNSDWYYSLNHLTANIGSDAIVAGEALNLTIADAQFDYLDAFGGCSGGGVTPDGSAPNGGIAEPNPTTAPTEPPAAQFHLYVTAADLSGTVDSIIVCDPATDPSGTTSTTSCNGGDPNGPPDAGGVTPGGVVALSH